jgi:subtilase-type serine protease
VKIFGIKGGRPAARHLTFTSMLASATALTLIALQPAMAAERPYGSFKLMTMNVHVNGYTDSTYMNDLVKLYRAANPDVIALQELFPIPFTQNYDYMGSLADMLKAQQLGDYRYNSLFGRTPILSALDPLFNLVKAGDRGVMTRLPGSSGTFNPLIWNNPVPYTVLDAGNGLPRTYIGSAHTSAADDPVNGSNLQDLGMTRTGQAKGYNALALSMKDPFILTGDFNAGDVSERGLHDAHGGQPAQYYPRGAYIDPDGTYSAKGEIVLSNIPVTLNILKHQYQLLQSDKEREQFKPHTAGDGSYTYPLNETWDWDYITKEPFSSKQWDRAKVDHMMAARPYAKWFSINDGSDTVVGAIRDKDLTQFTTVEDGKTVTHDISDHTPVAHTLQWTGPIIDHSTYALGTKDWIKVVWSAEAQKNPVKTEDGGKTFYLTRNNNRNDVYLGQVADENGNPNLNYLSNLNDLQNDPLTQPMTSAQVQQLSAADLANRARLLKELNAKLQFAKAPLNCSSNYANDARFNASDLANIKSYCMDDHSVFDEVRIQDGLTVRVDEDAALGRTYTQSGKGIFDAAYPYVTLNDGTLKISGTQMNMLDREVHLDGPGGVIDVDAAGNNLVAPRVFSGGGSLVKDGDGTLTFASYDRNTYTGRTIVRDGTLALAGYGDISSSQGLELYNRGSAFNIAATSYAPDNYGSLTIKGLTGEKGTKVELGNKSLIVNSGYDTLYEGIISGGVLSMFTKEGQARLKLTGDSSTSFDGKTYVNDGTLRVNGKLGGTIVVDNYWHTTVWPFGYWGTGKLDGTGQVGGISIASGDFSPGNSVGVLHTTGDTAFGTRSNFQLEAGAAGLDRLFVGGVASLDGSLTLMPEIDGDPARATTVVDLLNQRRTIISADNGINGRFASVKSQYLFIDNSVDYSANEVGTTLYRNATPFAAFGHTFNERSVAGGLESLSYGNKLHDQIAVATDAADLTRFYGAASGEIHASIAGALASDSRFVSDAATSRIRAANGRVAAISMPVLAYGEDGSKNAQLEAADTATNAFWTQIYGATSSIDGDGNAVSRDRDIGGFVTGLDGSINNGLFGNDWRFGLLAGYARTSLDGSGSDASVDSIQVGVYGGTKWNGLGLSYGANLGHHMIDTSRYSSLAGQNYHNEASYDATSVQLFGEAGYEIKTSFAKFEPFAAASYTHLKSDTFTETGGITALDGLSGSTDVTTTTLGLRASRDFAFSDRVTITARGMLGWNHAFGDVTPEARLAFDGGQAFTTRGLPLAQDALAVEAGFDVAVGKNTSVGISYNGLLSDRATDHALKADLMVRF